MNPNIKKIEQLVADTHELLKKLGTDQYSMIHAYCDGRLSALLAVLIILRKGEDEDDRK